jgi:hypothetical protein
MSDDLQNKDEEPVAERRRLLKQAMAGGIVGAALLPERWLRPVVDSVIVPAHAQTSPGRTSTTTAGPGTSTTTTPPPPLTTTTTTPPPPLTTTTTTPPPPLTTTTTTPPPPLTTTTTTPPPA